jgi:hypothetical protein
LSRTFPSEANRNWPINGNMTRTSSLASLTMTYLSTK